ncbi:hypothetical protein Q5P01_000257, partial [Channa striata]
CRCSFPGFPPFCVSLLTLVCVVEANFRLERPVSVCSSDSGISCKSDGSKSEINFKGSKSPLRKMPKREEEISYLFVNKDLRPAEYERVPTSDRLERPVSVCSSDSGITVKSHGSKAEIINFKETKSPLRKKYDFTCIKMLERPVSVCSSDSGITVKSDGSKAEIINFKGSKSPLRKKYDFTCIKISEDEEMRRMKMRSEEDLLRTVYRISGSEFDPRASLHRGKLPKK